jgi:transcription initiation factor IIE alpha subunit
MATITNIRNLKVGNVITLTYNNGTFKNFEVSRVEEKSWYCGSWRKSYGTIEEWFKCPNDIVKCEIV